MQIQRFCLYVHISYKKSDEIPLSENDFSQWTRKLDFFLWWMNFQKQMSKIDSENFSQLC